jgi:hypothetical protein
MVEDRIVLEFLRSIYVQKNGNSETAYISQWSDALVAKEIGQGCIPKQVARVRHLYLKRNKGGVRHSHNK